MNIIGKQIHLGPGNDEYTVSADSDIRAIFGQGGNDTITAHAGPGPNQFHIYAGGGRDSIILSFSGVDRFSLGHHARGDAVGIFRARDTFDFVNTHEVTDFIYGRIEDFDYSRDTIKVEGVVLDLFNLPSNIRIVESNGQHDDAGSYAQQWLVIETSTGGLIVYALEGARTDMDVEAGDEPHFLSVRYDFQELPSVEFIDQKNVVPNG